MENGQFDGDSIAWTDGQYITEYCSTISNCVPVAMSTAWTLARHKYKFHYPSYIPLPDFMKCLKGLISKLSDLVVCIILRSFLRGHLHNIVHKYIVF